MLIFSFAQNIRRSIFVIHFSQAAVVKRAFVLKCASSCAHARDLSVVAISANYVLLGPSPTYYVPLKTRVIKTCLCMPFVLVLHIMHLSCILRVCAYGEICTVYLIWSLAFSKD